MVSPVILPRSGRPRCPSTSPPSSRCTSRSSSSGPARAWPCSRPPSPRPSLAGRRSPPGSGRSSAWVLATGWSRSSSTGGRCLASSPPQRRSPQHRVRRGGSPPAPGRLDRGELHPGAASEEGAALLSVLVAGVMSQQLANQPRASWDQGRCTRLTPRVLELFRCAYPPERVSGDTDRDQQRTADPADNAGPSRRGGHRRAGGIARAA